MLQSVLHKELKFFTSTNYMLTTNIPRKDQQVISYLALRKLIGLTGVLLPLLLPVGCLIYGESISIQDSISDYYYTETRNILVGVLFVLGFFLLAYRGYEPIDSRFANFGFVFALGVALFPCQSEIIAVRVVHFVSAGLLFSVFIWFSLMLFTKTVTETNPTKAEKERNTLYVICGWVMIACLACIGLSFLVLNEEQRNDYNTTFWFESIALWAFGYSWLTKGKFMWRDEPAT